MFGNGLDWVMFVVLVGALLVLAGYDWMEWMKRRREDDER